MVFCKECNSVIKDAGMRDMEKAEGNQREEVR